MQNKILYIVNNINLIGDLKKVSINNFLFPLKGFCVGFNDTYTLDEIEENQYILVNRILDNKSLDELEELLKNNKKKIKGIVYDDFGVLYLINKLKLDVETICWQSHFLTNYESVNLHLNNNTSVVVSNDITKEEIDEICKNAKKEVCLFLAGFTMAMYSRRYLLKNFYDEFNIDYNNDVEIHDDTSKNDFIMVENEYGTVGYSKKFYNGLELIDNTNVKYFIVNPLFLNDEDSIKLISDIENKKISIDVDSDTGFLHKKTIYKIKEVPR